MTPEDHYAEAEHWLQAADTDVATPLTTALLARAQVHATLATTRTLVQRYTVGEDPS